MGPIDPSPAAAFRQLAAYNAWANARLFGAALAMEAEAYRRPVGAFFGSLHGTLNHLLVTDRIWLKRLTGHGDHPSQLDAIVHEDCIALTRARMAEDARLIAAVAAIGPSALAQPHDYATLSGTRQTQLLGDILLHVFNHQTHHRGQAHAICSMVTRSAPPSLDLLQYQRGAAAPDLATLIRELGA